MGILNVTNDSFSDGGKFIDQSAALNHAVSMVEQGADIIDIGGESTRPGAKSVSAEEELERVLPVVKSLVKKYPEIIISVDTIKSLVAEECLKSGAKIINDISGLKFDPRIVDVVKKYEASLIIMHMKGTPENMQNDPVYDDLIKEIYEYLYVQTSIAAKKKIESIFVDPGIGFGKTVEHNFEILNRLEDFKSLGYPILTGVSRKSFIGKTLNLKVEERDTATAVIDTLAVRNGARIIRTHNVKNGVQVCKLVNHIN